MGRRQSNGASVMDTLFNRVWPLAVVTLGLIATVAWLGLVGYGLIKPTHFVQLMKTTRSRMLNSQLVWWSKFIDMHLVVSINSASRGAIAANKPKCKQGRTPLAGNSPRGAVDFEAELRGLKSDVAPHRRIPFRRLWIFWNCRSSILPLRAPTSRRPFSKSG
jgi:hypothetical protein